MEITVEDIFLLLVSKRKLKCSQPTEWELEQFRYYAVEIVNFIKSKGGVQNEKVK